MARSSSSSPRAASRAIGGCCRPNRPSPPADQLRPRSWSSSKAAVAVTGFGSSRELERDELKSAAVRYPRPSRLLEPLELRGKKAQLAAHHLGLVTVGDLIGHLPRDRRE